MSLRSPPGNTTPIAFYRAAIDRCNEHLISLSRHIVNPNLTILERSVCIEQIEDILAKLPILHSHLKESISESVYVKSE